MKVMFVIIDVIFDYLSRCDGIVILDKDALLQTLNIAINDYQMQTEMCKPDKLSEIKEELRPFIDRITDLYYRLF